MKERWEYRITQIKPRFFEISSASLSARLLEELNRQGLEGWELAAAVQPQPFHALRLFFKRPR